MGLQSTGRLTGNPHFPGRTVVPVDIKNSSVKKLTGILIHILFIFCQSHYCHTNSRLPVLATCITHYLSTLFQQHNKPVSQPSTQFALHQKKLYDGDRVSYTSVDNIGC